MERLHQENEQLRQRLVEAEATTVVVADAEKNHALGLHKMAIQRAMKAEKERDEIIDGFICTRIAHLADQVTYENKSHLHSMKVEKQERNLQSWLAALRGEQHATSSEFRPITGFVPRTNTSCLSTPSRPSIRTKSTLARNEERTYIS